MHTHTLILTTEQLQAVVHCIQQVHLPYVFTAPLLAAIQQQMSQQAGMANAAVAAAGPTLVQDEAA